MTREDRLLLADLGRLNADVTPLALRIMDGTATTEEQYAFADRLTVMARRLHARAAQVGLVVEGDVADANGAVHPLHHRDR